MDRLEVKPLLIRQLETYIREPINCLTHLLGAVLSLIGMIALLVLSWGEPLHLISFAIYGMSSILLYMASSLLHGLRVSPERRRFFCVLIILVFFADCRKLYASGAHYLKGAKSNLWLDFF